MSYPRVRFVSAPDPAATVLLDLHGESGGVRMWPRSDAFDLGAPTLEGAADGIAVSYGDRSLSFTQIIDGPKSVALARQSALARLLLRPEGWLEFTLASFVPPIWFRLRYAEPQSLSFDQVRNDSGDLITDRWAIGMRLPAAAFARGERITMPLQQLVNNPVSGTPNMVVLPDVVGDAPAPARIRFRYGAGSEQLGRRHLLATSPVPEGYEDPIWWKVGTGDAWTIGTDVLPADADVDYVGGSYRAVTFGTATMATRISGPAPAAVAPGKYKVFARVARSDASSTFAVQFGVTTGFNYVYGDTIPLTWATSAVEHAAYVDVGTFRLPQGNPLLDLTNEPDVTPNIAFQAQRLSGTGRLLINGFLLIPVNELNSRTLFVDYPALAPVAFFDDEYHDTDLDMVYARRPLSANQLSSMAAPGLQGGFPVLVPGQRNALHWVEQTSTSRASSFYGNAPDRITANAGVLVSYQPLWLYIGDGS